MQDSKLRVLYLPEPIHLTCDELGVGVDFYRGGFFGHQIGEGFDERFIFSLVVRSPADILSYLLSACIRADYQNSDAGFSGFPLDAPSM